MKKITIAIPVHNESANIGETQRQLGALAASPAMARFEWEFLYVNDGSTDNSLELIEGCADADPRVRVVDLSRNFGKEAALLAAADYARGDAVVFIDADRQSPLEVIPQMIEGWEEGYDDVYALRVSRGRESWLYGAVSRAFYWALSKGSEVEMHPGECDFRLLSRGALDNLRSLRESERYTKGLFNWIGGRKKAIPICWGQRQGGRSSFGFRKLAHLAINGITGFSTMPLRLASVLGLVVSTIALLYMVFVLVKYFIYGDPVQGFATLLCVILILGGLQLFCLGILGEYIGHIFLEAKQRPPYLVRKGDKE